MKNAFIAHFEVITDTLPEAVLLLTREGMILVANRAARRLLDIDEVTPPTHLSLTQLVSDPVEYIDAFLRLCTRNEQMVYVPLTLQRADGEPSIYVVEGCVLAGSLTSACGETLLLTRWSEREDAAMAFVALNSRIEAITREKTHHHTMAQAYEHQLVRQEKQRNKSLGVMAGGIVHRFSNLLTAILTNSSLAIQKTPADAPVHRHLKRIHGYSAEASTLVQQILAYTGRTFTDMERIDLNVLLEKMLDSIEASVEPQVEVAYRPAPTLPPLAADMLQLSEVIMNLALNASEAIGDKPGRILIETEASYLSSSDLQQFSQSVPLPAGWYVLLKISDTGCGIEAAIVPRIFDPFFTTKFIGRGLGLATVQGIVQAHKGAVTLASTAAEGSRFVVILPAAEQTQPA